MNFSNILKDLSGSTAQQGSGLKGFTDKLPGGLAGGAVAGGLVAALIGSKSVRKTATTAAKYGGTAILGGLAYKAYQNWQHGKSNANQARTADHHQGFMAQQQSASTNFEREALAHADGILPAHKFQLALVKAMIASARADGSIDIKEQGKISEAIESMDLDQGLKSQLLELFIKPISIDDFINELETPEQRAEAYLASCLVIDLDHQGEYAHLSNLAKALDLPPGLEQQLRHQAGESSLLASA